jgi:putative hydrolase of the HAD superfamily
MTRQRHPGGAGAGWRRDLAAISFDFGNTLVPFPGGPMARVVEITAGACAPLTGGDREGFVRAWGVERLRQFAQDVPAGREADMDVRARRVLATLRGARPPEADGRWDDAGLSDLVADEEVAAILDTYADAFVALTPVPAPIAPMLERLAARYRLGITSNWPLSLAVERYLDRAGWSAHLTAIVVSHRVGSIKPDPRIFEVAASELGVPSGPAIIHVGDDPGADVVGPAALGWRTAWVTLKPEDSTLPVAPPAPEAKPDLIIDTVLELEAALEG